MTPIETNTTHYLSSEDSQENSSKDHILACLSPVPANQRVIRSAAKCASLYKAPLTAIFIETSFYTIMSREERRILKENMRLAESYGADVITLHGEDAAYLIEEYCKVNHVTHLILGRTYLKSQKYFRTHNLADKLRDRMPEVEFHVVSNPGYRDNRLLRFDRTLTYKGILQDIFICAMILTASAIIGTLFDEYGLDDANIVSLFILAVVLCCMASKRAIMCVICSLIAIFIFDYMFVAPRGALITYNTGYMVTFFTTFVTALIIGTLTQSLKASSASSAQSSFRTQKLFDTSRLLQKAADPEDVIAVTIRQIAEMTERNTAFLKYEDGKIVFRTIYNQYNSSKMMEESLNQETETALWAIENKKIAGASTLHYRDSRFLYIPCYTSTSLDGVVAVELKKDVLDSLESTVARAIVSEGSLALENMELARAVKSAEIKAQSEEIRADLLRAISHDLRTPLTVINGNIGNLKESNSSLSEEERDSVYDAIYENSVWLTNLVENLLTASHFENGTIQVHPEIEMISDIIEDVLLRPIHQSSNRNIEVDIEDDLLMARMDAQMIARVIHNLLTNAMENTDPDTRILVHCFQDQDEAVIEVCDEGKGIEDSMKPQIFDMFYIGNRKVIDSRKSMGLGLFLCSKIAKAHGGTLSLSDNVPHGCRFALRLPLVSLPENDEVSMDFEDPEPVVVNPESLLEPTRLKLSSMMDNQSGVDPLPVTTMDETYQSQFEKGF